MPLTAKGVESAKPRPGAKVTKLSDGGGLQLWITPTGSKLWRLAYRFGGKQKLVAIGAYPIVTLKEARERRDEHKRVLERGRDPSVERKVRSSNTFNAVADDYLAWLKSAGRAEATITKNSWLIDMARPNLGTAQSRRLPLLTSSASSRVLRRGGSGRAPAGLAQ